MAQRQVNPDSVSYNGESAATFTSLRNSIKAGNVVTAANINSVISMINKWDNHTHTYTDRYQQATFGNNGDRNLYQESKTTAKHDQASTDVPAVAVGDTITASKHNAMTGQVNNLQNGHRHIINDRTS